MNQKSEKSQIGLFDVFFNVFLNIMKTFIGANVMNSTMSKMKTNSTNSNITDSTTDCFSLNKNTKDTKDKDTKVKVKNSLMIDTSANSTNSANSANGKQPIDMNTFKLQSHPLFASSSTGNVMYIFSENGGRPLRLSVQLCNFLKMDYDITMTQKDIQYYIEEYLKNYYIYEYTFEPHIQQYVLKKTDKLLWTKRLVQFLGLCVNDTNHYENITRRDLLNYVDVHLS